VHDDGAKAILSVGGWTLSHRVSEMLASPTARAAFVDNAVAILEDWGFDGLDLDFEFPGYAPHGGRPIDKQNFALLLGALRQRFDAIETATGRAFELTAAVSCGPQIANDAYDYPAVAGLLDYVHLLSYDFGGDWDPVAQHNSPLYLYDGQIHTGFDADACREFWSTTGGVPAEKLVLGMAHYGRSFAGATAIGDPSGGHDAAHWAGDTETRYHQIRSRIETDPSFHVAYDPVANTHYGWFDGGGFISFEDTTSLAERARYVVDEGLAGVMIWQLRGGMVREGATWTYPLLDATLAALAGGGTPPETGTTYVIEAVAGEGGRIEPAGAVSVVEGGTARFTASPDEGWVVDLLEVDGEAHDGASFTFSNVAADHVIVAHFAPAPEEDAGACTPFVQPYAGDAPYVAGDRVLFGGVGYVSTFAPNWWSPSAAPAYWAATSCDEEDGGDDGGVDEEDGGDDGGDGDEDGGDDSPGDGVCPDFVQPYAGDPSYRVGDKVVFGGTVYVSTFAPNWWSPAAAPQYWAESDC
jgi:chitinase